MGFIFKMLSILLAFGFGILSFLSPCVLPLIPSYLCYITGLSFEEIVSVEKRTKIQKQVVLHSLMFIIGFSIIFVILGATATALGSSILRYKELVQRIAGILVFLFGLYFTGIIKVKFFETERRFVLKNKPLGFLGSVLVGMAFGAGWSPCIGPFLGSILSIAATAEKVTFGIILLSAYSLGLGLPFLLAGLLFSWFLTCSKKIYRYMPLISKISGVLLMIIGVLIFLGYFNELSARLF